MSKCQSLSPVWFFVTLSGPSVHRILQARILEWVAIPFSRDSSQPRDQTWVSCVASGFFTIWTTTLQYKIKRVFKKELNSSFLSCPCSTWPGPTYSPVHSPTTTPSCSTPAIRTFFQFLKRVTLSCPTASTQCYSLFLGCFPHARQPPARYHLSIPSQPSSLSLNVTCLIWVKSPLS